MQVARRLNKIDEKKNPLVARYFSATLSRLRVCEIGLIHFPALDTNKCQVEFKDRTQEPEFLSSCYIF
jgi:hypothetical protein